MGLTVYYDFRLPLAVPADEVQALLGRWRALAAELDAGPVTRVRKVTRHQLFMTGLHYEPKPHGGGRIGHEVPVEEGFAFALQPAEGCEPLRIALCRYAGEIVTRRGLTPTKLDGAWRYQSFCKTQYAGLHGWDNFLAAHRAVVACLAHGRKLGVRVRIRDDGGYWPRCDEAALRRNLDEMNGIVAAFAGAMKDAVEETGAPGKLAAPILAHPQFERLELAGQPRVGRAANLIRRIARQRRKP
jgi:hypothetical protein